MDDKILTPDPDEFVQVKKSELNQILTENREMKSDISSLAENLSVLETRYQLFTTLGRLSDTNFIQMGKAILNVLRKILRDPQKNAMFSGLRDLAIKYAHLATKK